MSLIQPRPDPTGPTRGRCGTCERSFTVLANGRLRMHGHTQGRPGSECPGSGGPPSREPHVQERQHDRRTQ